MPNYAFKAKLTKLHREQRGREEHAIAAQLREAHDQNVFAHTATRLDYERLLTQHDLLRAKSNTPTDSWTDVDHARVDLENAQACAIERHNEVVRVQSELDRTIHMHALLVDEVKRLILELSAATKRIAHLEGSLAKGSSADIEQVTIDMLAQCTEVVEATASKWRAELERVETVPVAKVVEMSNTNAGLASEVARLIAKVDSFEEQRWETEEVYDSDWNTDAPTFVPAAENPEATPWARFKTLYEANIPSSSTSGAPARPADPPSAGGASAANRGGSAEPRPSGGASAADRGGRRKSPPPTSQTHFADEAAEEEEEWEEEEQEDPDDRRPARGRDQGRKNISSSRENDDDDEEVVTKHKEAEKVLVPGFPTVTTLRAWRMQLGKNLVTASSKKDCKEIPWLLETLAPEATFESLADSGLDRFRSLDIKLSTALTVTVRNAPAASALADDIHLKEEAVFNHGGMLAGRQILLMIYDFFKTNRSLDVIYSVEDLTSLQWMGDKDMHTFRFYWDQITGTLRDRLDEATLANILVKKLEKSAELSEDIARYYRQNDGDKDHSYTYLRDCMTRCLQRRLQKTNRDGQTDLLRGRSKTPAAPGPPKGEGRGRGGGGKGGDKGGRKKKGPRSESRGVCYWFNHGGCWRVECHFDHTTLPKAEADKMTRPTPRSPSPGGKGPKGKDKKGKGKGKEPKGKGKGKGKDKGGQKVNWCKKFLEGGCTHDPCKYPHLTEDVVAEIKRAMALNAVEPAEKPGKRKKN